MGIHPLKPAGTDSIREGDNVIRTLAAATVSAIAKDHFVGVVGTQGDYDNADVGEHVKVTLRATDEEGDPYTEPNATTNENLMLYAKFVGDNDTQPELFITDGTNRIQLTSGGVIGGSGSLLLESTSGASIVLNNTTDSDAEGARESVIEVKGLTATSEIEHTLIKISASHDLSDADVNTYAGKIVIDINDGSSNTIANNKTTITITSDDIDMGGLVLKNIGTPVDGTDAVTKDYADATFIDVVHNSSSISVPDLEANPDWADFDGDPLNGDSTSDDGNFFVIDSYTEESAYSGDVYEFTGKVVFKIRNRDCDMAAGIAVISKIAYDGQIGTTNTVEDISYVFMDTNLSDYYPQYMTATVHGYITLAPNGSLQNPTGLILQLKESPDRTGAYDDKWGENIWQKFEVIRLKRGDAYEDE